MLPRPSLWTGKCPDKTVVGGRRGCPGRPDHGRTFQSSDGRDPRSHASGRDASAKSGAAIGTAFRVHPADPRPKGAPKRREASSPLRLPPVRRDGGRRRPGLTVRRDHRQRITGMIVAGFATRSTDQRRARTKASSCSATLAAVGMEGDLIGADLHLGKQRQRWRAHHQRPCVDLRFSGRTTSRHQPSHMPPPSEARLGVPRGTSTSGTPALREASTVPAPAWVIAILQEGSKALKLDEDPVPRPGEYRSRQARFADPGGWGQ